MLQESNRKSMYESNRLLIIVSVKIYLKHDTLNSYLTIPVFSSVNINLASQFQ